MTIEKEKMNRQVIFQVQQSLYDQFSTACETNYKKISDVLRELMLEYSKKYEPSQMTAKTPHEGWGANLN